MGLSNHASERCCAQPLHLPLPLAQSYIQYTDVTRVSCPLFAYVRSNSKHSATVGSLDNENEPVLVIQTRQLKHVQSCNFSVAVVCML